MYLENSGKFFNIFYFIYSLNQIISEIWLIQIAKNRLLWISQISLIQSVKINWIVQKKNIFHFRISENYFFIGESVKKQFSDSTNEKFTESEFESKYCKVQWAIYVYVG